MEIYRLTTRGEMLAHSYRAPRTPIWGVVFFLSKRGAATKEQIIANVPGASSAVLARLRVKKIIQDQTGVGV